MWTTGAISAPFAELLNPRNAGDPACRFRLEAVASLCSVGRTGGVARTELALGLQWDFLVLGQRVRLQGAAERSLQLDRVAWRIGGDVRTDRVCFAAGNLCIAASSRRILSYGR
jgi:hypothetical protein